MSTLSSNPQKSVDTVDREQIDSRSATKSAMSLLNNPPGNFTLLDFQTEPLCWWPNGLGGFMKPDAYAIVEATARDHWWIEVDKSSEHLPTLHKKFTTYLDFIRRGQLGPHDVIPRVLVTVPHQARYDAVAGLLARLPEPAERLFSVALEHEAAIFVARVLRE